MMQITPTGGPLGARVAGLDLSREPDASEVARVVQALRDYLVLVFPGQQLDEPQQVRFTRHFGTPVAHVREQPDRPIEEIFVISNVHSNGSPVGALGNSELEFHSDLSYMPSPGTVSLLYAVEVPAHGGDTSWANCYLAFEKLDDATKQRIAGLRAVHRHPIPAQNPAEPIAHPVVRTHPHTQRKSLYVSPHLTTAIAGLEEGDSQVLLRQLCQHATAPRFVWTHHWRVGDLVVWDNRATMHRREPFPQEERRVMKRTQVFGDEVPV